jgi:hypothetical protein
MVWMIEARSVQFLITLAVQSVPLLLLLFAVVLGGVLRSRASAAPRFSAPRAFPPASYFSRHAWPFRSPRLSGHFTASSGKPLA